MHVETELLPDVHARSKPRCRSSVYRSIEEYVYGIVHTNFAESYFSLLKRGILGTFHHVSEKHLPRYLREFEYRWNRRHTTDGERTSEAIKMAKGKRLMYRGLPSER